jgi:lipopolysaccharide/colanic/teichoic acid biosynthesis glycosyltransferase
MSQQSSNTLVLDVEAVQPAQVQQRLTYLTLKRVIDIFGSLTLLLMLSPIFLLTATSILLFDGGPVFFRQIRVGQHSAPFNMWKFRSMRPRPAAPADSRSAMESAASQEDPYTQWTNGVPDDFMFKSGFHPEVTRIGRFLRSSSLDELPQLINVLMGDMSLIGPRPEVPGIAKYYSEQQRGRLMVKPGITGYAQVNGRSLIPHGEKIRNDLHYVRNVSLRLDLLILWKTLLLVLGKKGAF